MPWIKKSLELARKTLVEVTRKRGKNLRVYRGLDMKGV